MLVNRAALDRHAVPDDGRWPCPSPGAPSTDEELGRSQAALDENSSEDGAPGLGALAAHALDREQHLLAVLAHAKDDKEPETASRFAVEPHAAPLCPSRMSPPRSRSSASERPAFHASPVGLHLAPDSAHRSLPTAPPNREALRARRTRRVLVPAR